MKLTILTLALASFAASAAQAAPLCGSIGTHVVGPHCQPGQMCPQWRRLQYDIQTDDGKVVDINASQPDVLQAFGDNNGKEACVNGALQADGSYLVSSVSGR